MAKAYISGPLHSVDNLEKAREFYTWLGQICDEEGFAPYLPHLYTDPVIHANVSAEAVFEKDYQGFSTADIIVADLSAPSLGVGAELAIAYKENIPIIGIYPAQKPPSRFILGMLLKGNNQLVSYGTLDECQTLVRTALKNNFARLMVGCQL